MKWSNTRRGKNRTRRTRQFAKYHQTTGPIVGAVAVAVGAGFASYFAGPAAGAAVTAAGAGVAYAGGSYWGATAARGEGESGREAREAGRKVGRRAAMYAGIGGATGTLVGWGTAYATDGGFYAPTETTTYYMTEGGETTAYGADAGLVAGESVTTTTAVTPSTASASYGLTGEQASQALKAGGQIYSALAPAPGVANDAVGAFGGYGVDPGAMGSGGGGGGGGGDADPMDPLTVKPEAKGGIFSSDAMKIGLILLGLSMVLK